MTAEKEMVIVPETHWDREWYLPFQEYRAKLVILTDKLLEILETNPKFTNFTFDGQTIVLEDYLEVKPEKEELLRKYIQERRISVGPWYSLPDEFLVSGESLIRNLMLGHKIARSFGRVMRAGYIPDPFGHIAQLPQIMQGFGIDSIIFMRGMDDSMEELGLNLEFLWDSPQRVTSVLAIHLRYGYGSVTELPTHKSKGIYKAALHRIKKVQSKLLKHSASTILLLNNGSDHVEVQGEIPEIIENWNSDPKLNEFKLVQNDFEYYIEHLKKQKLELKRYEGEFRGSRYHPILSGVFSARMWIKQFNTECQYLLENWAEPFAAWAWTLGESYPQNYLWAGWKWLLRNHPHDSICGCSIDEVHRDMRTRFVWAKQIADEVLKDAMFAIYKRIKVDSCLKKEYPFLVFNSHPWIRTDIAYIDISVPGTKNTEFEFPYELINSSNQEVPFQIELITERPRLQTPKAMTYRLSFLAEDVPACGYELYYLRLAESAHKSELDDDSFSLENEFYKVMVQENGTFSVHDKELQKTFENLGLIEDLGDWGDEYDYSPPPNPENDSKVTNKNVKAGISIDTSGPAKRTIQIEYNLEIASSLSADRVVRSKITNSLPITTYITLYPKIKRIDIKVEMDNQSKDHRVRILFPSSLKANKVYVDGHFAVIERPITLPEGLKWKQPPSKTNHQLKFATVKNDDVEFTVCNRGLPEYEAIEEKDGSITLAITLLRCVGWLALPYLVTRKEIAGPAFATPEAQCLGKIFCNLSITTQKTNASHSNRIGQEFNSPLKTFNPAVMRTALRIPDHIFFRGLPLGLPPDKSEDKTLPLKMSFLKLEPDYLILSSCKRAEEDEALIIRIYNQSISPTKGTMKFYQAILDVKIVNMDEQDVKDSQITNIKVKDSQLAFQIVGNKIATFKIYFS